MEEALLLIMVSIKPNKSDILANIKSYKPADDGGGGWVELEVQTVTEIPNEEHFCKGLEGKVIQAFVPPPLTSRMNTNIYAGQIRSTGDAYALIPPRSSPPPGDGKEWDDPGYQAPCQ